MVLIVLIFHFLIKNYLVERALEYPVQQRSTEEKQNSSVPVQQGPAPAPVVVSPPPSAPKNVPPEQFIDKEAKADEELLQYVFGTQESKQVSSANPATPPPANKAHAMPSAEETGGGKHFTVIKEYDNENMMNGGGMFKDIQGFEFGTDDNFQSLDAFFAPVKN